MNRIIMLAKVVDQNVEIFTVNFKGFFKGYEVKECYVSGMVKGLMVGRTYMFNCDKCIILKGNVLSCLCESWQGIEQ